MYHVRCMMIYAACMLPVMHIEYDHLHVQVVVVGDEGASCGTPRDHVHHGGLHLCREPFRYSAARCGACRRVARKYQERRIFAILLGVRRAHCWRNGYMIFKLKFQKDPLLILTHPGC